MMTSRRRSPPRSDDATLTLDELAAKGREALVLLCDGLDLETAGPVSDLAQRLYLHYHPAVEKGSSPTPPRDTSPRTQLGLKLSSEGSESSDESNSDDDDSPESRRRHRAKTPSEQTTDQNNDGGDGDQFVDIVTEKHDGVPKSKKTTRSNSANEEQKSTQEYENETDLIGSALEASATNAKMIQTLFDKVNLINSGSELQMAELRAIRSEIMKKKPPAPTPAAAPTTGSAKQKSGKQSTAASGKADTQKVATKTSKHAKVKTTPKKNVIPKSTASQHKSRSRSPHHRTSRRSVSPHNRSSRRSVSPHNRSSKKSPRRGRSSRKSSSPDHRQKRKRKHSDHGRKRKRSSSSSGPSSGNNSSSSSSPRCSRRRRSKSPSFKSPTPPPMISPNLYTPAPISTSDINKIEKGRYVNFKKLRPRCIDAKTREERSSNVEMKYSTETGTYSFERTSSESIETFTRWMEAWNAFVQTRLSFRPHEHFALFSYLKLISTLATQFKFSAVYSYDIDFRCALAAQRKIPPSQRTAIWGIKNQELANIHLTENQRLPPPKCFTCNNTGHVATQCPNPKQKEVSRSGSKGESKGPKGNKNDFRNEDEIDTCIHWNRGKCNRGANCRYLHKCSNCRNSHEHTGPNCPGTTSTRFRPGH